MTRRIGLDRTLTMNPVVIAAVVGVSVVVAVVVACIVRARRPAVPACLDSLLAWQDLAAAERIERLERWLAEPGREGRDRAVGLVMLGCAWLDLGAPERAARPFQVAYHAEPSYESVLVLAYTCMKLNDRTAGDMLTRLIETWQEVGRPTLGASRRERALLTACRRGCEPSGGSELAAALAALPSSSLRGQIDDALSARPAWAAPLWDSRRDD